MSSELIETRFDSGILTITLNRPETGNAFAGRMRRDLAFHLEHAGSDTHVRVIILRGAGDCFCTGSDMETLNDLLERKDTDEAQRLLGAARRVVTAIRQVPKPVVASIAGAAHGAGFNLALACDIRIAAESATFSELYIRFGFHPDWGGTYFLPRIVAPNIACELFFLGDTINARRALELGIVNRVVADAELESETRKLAERLCRAPREPIVAAKQAVYMSDTATLEEMLQYETEAQLRCFQTADAREGVRAHIEGREPRFGSRK